MNALRKYSARRRQPPAASRQPAPGFTLIEVVLVMTLLAIVLGITYEILVDCLAAERKIDRLTIPEKVGDGILSLVRTDLAGTIYRHLGRRVFLVTDSGSPPEARDEIRFLSTVEPTPIEEGAGDSAAFGSFRTITGIAYFLRPSQLPENVVAYTLFRKEVVDLDPTSPLESPGMNYEIYDKVKSLSFECFDGWEWFPVWDSEARIQDEETQLLQAAEANEGEIARVSDPKTNPLAPIAPGVNPEAAGSAAILPPAAVPIAVRMEVSIYAGTGNKIDRDPNGNPIVKTFAMVIPLLAAQRIPIELDEEMGMDGAAGGVGADGGTPADGTAPEGFSFRGGVETPGKAGAPGGGRGRRGGAPGAGGRGRIPPGALPPGALPPRGGAQKGAGPGAKR